jgi:hypothetical protein
MITRRECSGRGLWANVGWWPQRLLQRRVGLPMMVGMPLLARMRSSSAVALLAIVVLAGAFAGCLREDQNPGMTIWNRTAASVTVNYRRVVGTTEMESLVMEISSGQRVIIPGLHQAEGDCIRGTLIAIQTGRTIATLSKPCQGAAWEITGPDATSSPLRSP